MKHARSATRPSPRPPTRRLPLAVRRRGSVLLEVLLASFLLAMIAMTITSVQSFVHRSNTVHQQRLGAYEVANRLMLQYLDDQDAFKGLNRYYDDGRFFYTWELEELPLKIDAPADSVMDAPREGSGRNAADTLRLLIIRVNEGRPDGAGGAIAGEQLAELRRVHSPLALMTRNPDSAAWMLSDQARSMALMQRLMSGGMNPGLPGAPTAPGPRPPPGSPK